MSPSAGKFLLLGVGGMGMAPLSGWMAQAGYSVCGYDDYLQEPVRRFLSDSGVELRDFIFAEQLSEFSVVVYSSALQPDHPLLSAAKAQGLTVLRRGEMLARVAETKRLIAVVGSHGKTTTCGMIAHGIRRCGIEADYIVGGFFNDRSVPPSQFVDSEWLIAEVDESDGTIDGFSPEVTLVLNIDWDHADRYQTSDMIDGAFCELVARTQQQVLVPDGSDLFERLATHTQANVVTYGAELEALNAAPGGAFNQSNGAAACSVLSFLTDAVLPLDVMSSFGGIARRQAVLHDSSELTIVEDYAHHPTEIEALVKALRAQADGRRLVVVFQSHRYSRTRQFKSEFAESLVDVDELFLLPVYPAHEQVLEGGDVESLLAAFDPEVAELLSMDLEGLGQLAEAVQGEPALLAFVGAGDLDQFGAVFTSLIRSEFDLDAAWFDYLKDRVSEACVLKAQEPLANKTTMRVGGAARFYAEPSNLCDLRALLKATDLFELPHFTLGRGSNLVVPDAGYTGLVIRFSGQAWRRIEVLSNGRIWAGAGVRLKEICGQAAKAGLAGFEFLEGIPGSLGGSLRMNAGAMGNWMFDVVERVQMLDAETKLVDLPKDHFHFGYRKVEEISEGIALGAILCAADTETTEAIRERIDTYSSTRKSSQPRDPSAGCIFKNPEGNYAGKLVDEHGIKGMSVGAAEVSDVHGNFIVNKGGATSADVVELVRRVRARVKEASGYELEPEVLLLGQSWEEVLAEGGDHV